MSDTTLTDFLGAWATAIKDKINSSGGAVTSSLPDPQLTITKIDDANYLTAYICCILDFLRQTVKIDSYKITIRHKAGRR